MCKTFLIILNVYSYIFELKSRFKKILRTYLTTSTGNLKMKEM